MLILEDVESAIPLVQELEDRKIRLSAKMGPLALLASELSVAVASCGSMAAMQAEGYRENLSQIVSMIHESSASVTRTEHGSMLDTSKHDVKLDEFSFSTIDILRQQRNCLRSHQMLELHSKQHELHQRKVEMCQKDQFEQGYCLKIDLQRFPGQEFRRHQ